MLEDLSIFRMAGALAAHAEARQNTIAQNVANSDTPGYRARDIAPFAESYHADEGGLPLQASRASHLATSSEGFRITERVDESLSSAPNGNSVTNEKEMVKGAETRHQHDLALTIYRSALGIMRSSLGR
jgi:flagellar basal-body rod protein FlgB